MLPNFSILYSIPYLLLVFVLFILSLIEYKCKKTIDKKTITIIYGAIITIFIGLRGHIQTDFIGYYPFFNSLPVLFSSEFSLDSIDKFEPGFVVYSSLIKQLFPNYFIWVFINTLIDVIILSIFFRKYSASIGVSWIFFLLFGGLVCEFNLFRNVKAIMIFILSIPFIKERRFIPFFLLWLLEMTFHTSSILYLPMYWILNRIYPKYLIYTVFITVNIVLFANLHPTSLLIEYLTNQMSEEERAVAKAINYFGKGEESSFGLGYIEKTLLYILCSYYYLKLYKINKFNIIFCNAFFIYYTLWYIFGDVKIFVERFPILFAFSYWIICPNLLSITRKKYRSLVVSAVFIFLIMKTISLTNQRPYYYENLIFGIESYETKKYLIQSWNRS